LQQMNGGRCHGATSYSINYAGARQRKCRAALARDAGKEMRMTKLLERATPRNHPHTAICPVCGDRFARGRHSNRHKGAGRKTVAWSTYCSRACRQAAYRIRKDIHNNVLASARRRRPAKRRLPPLSACVTSAPERLPGSYPHTCVTRPEISQRVQGPATPKKRPYLRTSSRMGSGPACTAYGCRTAGSATWSTSPARTMQRMLREANHEPA
jgi:hypothetical protein